MGYVEFAKIKHAHTFTMYPTTSRKICTIKTLVPETTTNFSPTDSMGATSRVHVHKNESTRPHKQRGLDRLQNQWYHK